MWSNSHTSLMSEPARLLPLSDNISLGNPSLEKILDNALAIDMLSVFANGITSGYLLAKSITVNINLFPVFVRGSGPTMSIAIRFIGVSMTGRGFRGAR